MSTIYPSGSIILAPLAGYTDLPYRRSAQRHGCRLAFTEMIDAGSLIFGHRKTLRFLERGESEEWLGIQLVGSDTDTLARAAEIVNGYNFDLLDFNLGCPAPKVAKKGEGAALAQRPDDALRAFESLVRVSRIPVTVKTRILDEEDPAPTVALAKGLEAAGARAITIHGRIAKNFYSGPVYYEIIAAVRSALKIQVIANGGINGRSTLAEARLRSGCDCVMLARGAMGNPWLFGMLGNVSQPPPSVAELADEMDTHIRELIEFYGEELGMKISRKVVIDYIGGRGYPGTLRQRISSLVTLRDFESFMEDVRRGPSPHYWQFLHHNPGHERALRQEACPVSA
ncbi:MAG: hypothetical protein A2X49_17125 [Lentisphaerae bacterium GWF2_52_8]|nr:MAG: hypothetical protein A2X49_17125 [Lentisphaerae bacterium GWF2_52_8]